MVRSMDKQLARMVVTAASRSAADLSDLVPTLKEHCSEEFYAELKPGIGSAIYEILESVRGPIFKRFPELKLEFEQNLEEFGRGC